MRAARARRRGGRGGTLVGIFIGLILGLGMAAGVAYWLMRNNPAFEPRQSAATAPREPGKDAPRTGARSDAVEKPRFDFYKILPGTEEARVAPDRKTAERPDRTVVEQAKERAVAKPVDSAPAKAPQVVAGAAPGKTPAGAAPADASSKAANTGERYWLQAGSFAAEADAENLRARLAFVGLEASVQTGTTPDKAIRYRVRIGPYDNQDEMQRAKNELSRRGFESTVIRN
jgi:cell division protein FtsN